MMFFIELQYFDGEDLTKIRRKMLADSIDDVQWVEWTAGLSSGCKQPDLTLIGPQHLSWIELAKLANSAAGQQVVLVRGNQFELGLQTLPIEFTMLDLLAFMPWSRQERAQQFAAAKAYSKNFALDYKRTVPVEFS